MYCNSCGNFLEDNAKFCSKCGAEVTTEGFINMSQVQEKADNSKLIKDLSVALPIYEHLSGLYDEIFELQYKQNKKWKFLFVIVLYVLATSLVTSVFTIIGDIIALVIPSILNMTVGMIIVISSYILGVFVVMYIKKLKYNYYQKKIDVIESEMQAYLKQHDCPELYSLPERYRNYVAGKFIYEVLTSGRADSLKEAMNLYEQQVHIWDLEAKQQKIESELDRQRRQNQRMRRDNDLLSAILLFK